MTRLARVLPLLAFLSACVAAVEERPLNYACQYDAGVARSDAQDPQCPEGFRCGLDGRCHQRGLPEALPCESDVDCEGGWTCDVFQGVCVEPSASTALRGPPSGAYALAELAPREAPRLAAVSVAWVDGSGTRRQGLSLVSDAGLRHGFLKHVDADLGGTNDVVTLTATPLGAPVLDLAEREPATFVPRLADGGSLPARSTGARTYLLDALGLEEHFWEEDRETARYPSVLGERLRVSAGAGAPIFVLDKDRYSFGRFGLGVNSSGGPEFRQLGATIPGADGGAQEIFDIAYLRRCAGLSFCRSIVLAAAGEGLSIALMGGNPDIDPFVLDGERFTVGSGGSLVPLWRPIDARSLPNAACATDAGTTAPRIARRIHVRAGHDRFVVETAAPGSDAGAPRLVVLKPVTGPAGACPPIAATGYETALEASAECEVCPAGTEYVGLQLGDHPTQTDRLIIETLCRSGGDTQVLRIEPGAESCELSRAPADPSIADVTKSDRNRVGESVLVGADGQLILASGLHAGALPLQLSQLPIALFGDGPFLTATTATRLFRPGALGQLSFGGDVSGLVRTPLASVREVPSWQLFDDGTISDLSRVAFGGNPRAVVELDPGDFPGLGPTLMRVYTEADGARTLVVVDGSSVGLADVSDFLGAGNGPQAPLPSIVTPVELELAGQLISEPSSVALSPGSGELRFVVHGLDRRTGTVERLELLSSGTSRLSEFELPAGSWSALVSVVGGVVVFGQDGAALALPERRILHDGLDDVTFEQFAESCGHAYGLGGEGLYRLDHSDGAGTWTKVELPAPLQGDGLVGASLFPSANALLLATRNGAVFRLTPPECLP